MGYGSKTAVGHSGLCTPLATFPFPLVFATTGKDLEEVSEPLSIDSGRSTLSM